MTTRRRRFLTSHLGVTCLLGLAAVLGATAQAELDAERAAWRYRRAVSALEPEARFGSMSVPPELAAHSQPDLHDLRLVSAGGAEVPYVVDRVVPRDERASFAGRLLDARREPLGLAKAQRSRSTWVLDLGEPRAFDSVAVRIEARDFVKRVRVAVSEDAKTWRVVAEDAGVFDLPWTPRVHHTDIGLPGVETARYVRLTTRNDPESPPVEVSGIGVARRRQAEGATWQRRVTFRAETQSSRSRYRLDLPGSFPLERLTLDARDAAFARRVRLLATAPGDPEERVLGEALVYRVALADAGASGAQLSVPVTRRPAGDGLVLEVEDGDSPPLRGLELTASGTISRLLYPAEARALTLYYGNALTRAPLYDLEPLRERLALSGALSDAVLGPEAENPRYQKATPLPLAPLRGAAIEQAHWRWSRTLVLSGAEDLYALTLAPEDVGLMRLDLGDLRMVDAEGLQVPYVIEPAAVEAHVAMTLELESRQSSPAGGVISRYRVGIAPVAGSERVSLPLRSVEVDVAEALFDRTARVLADGGDRHGERLLRTARLTRLSDTAPSPRPRFEVLGLDGARVSELMLQVDEGDNAPLTLRLARGAVAVPRVTFKASAGRYRLLLGNPDASVPRYDLASLRHQVLSYSALPVSASPAEANLAFRRSAADYFRNAPPTLLLWGTLVAAIVALLLLTLRAIRAPGDGQE